MKTAYALAIMALLQTTAHAAPAPCPKFTPGRLYPWETAELMSGDQYAWVYLLIDKRGRAIDCRIGQTNMRDQNTRAILCLSFKKNWYTNPIPDAEGKPVEGWFKRYFVNLGTKHQQKNTEARKIFFEQHPEERRECYPEYTR